MSDSDAPSESLLDTPRPMQAGSDVEEGEEASQRPAATATQATQSDAEGDDEEDGAPPRKKINVSEQLTMDQEQELVEFFAVHPLFYHQMLKEFKDLSKKDRLPGRRPGHDLWVYNFSLTEAVKLLQHCDVLITFMIYFHKY